MTILALVLLGLSVVALTLLLMVVQERLQNRISLCLGVVIGLFLVACYQFGQGAR